MHGVYGIAFSKSRTMQVNEGIFFWCGGERGVGVGGVGGVTTILTLNEGQCKIIKKNHYKKNSDDHQYKHV